MHFESEEALRNFLGAFLDHLGVSYQKDFQLMNGWRVDMLTQNLLIECKLKLTLSSLDRAWSQVKRYRYHLQDRDMIIAGLSDSSGEPAMEIIQQDDIEIWQLDKMPLLQDYYRFPCGKI